MVDEEHVCCEEDLCLCSAEGILNVVSKKWAICIVSLLGSRKDGYRFNKLKNRLDGISSKSLSDKLKELEKEGLVNRDVKDSVPPKVVYTLTEDGKTLRTALKPLVEWVKEKE